MAKQYVPTTPDGGVIGDGILFREAEEEYIVRRPRAGRQLAAVPRRDRRLRRRDRARRPLALAPVRQGGHARAMALPDPGPERLAGHREAQRRPDRAASSSSAWAGMNVAGEQVRTLRHGMAGAPGPRDLGPVRGLRQDPRRDPRGRARVRPRARAARAPTRRTRSSRAGSRRRCPPIYTGEELRALPRVAAGRTATRPPTRSPAASSRTTSRTTTSTRGSSATAIRQVRPRLHRARRARGDRPGTRSARR